MRTGVYPGTFNPPTVAHFAIARAAIEQRRLDRVVLVLSRSPINKEHVQRPTLEERIAVLCDDLHDQPGIDVAITDARLLVDIADGFDVLIMGADKWAQVNDQRYYANRDECAAALARLPELAIAPRPGFAVPRQHLLDVPSHLARISSTAARNGDQSMMTPAARASGFWQQNVQHS